MTTTEERTRKLLRLNAAASGAISLAAGCFLYYFATPYPKTLAFTTALLGLCYFAYFLFFDRICRCCYREAGIALSQLGAAAVTYAVYFTGGVVSPLSFLYLAMPVSEAIYGLENPVTVPFSSALYLITVYATFFGLFPNPAPWSEGLYRSPALVILISSLLVAYMFLTKKMSGRIMANLRAAVEEETAAKEALIGKFSELNSTTQLGVLAHRIAHDLRGPIASISGYLELEMAKSQPPEKMEELRSVSETVANMVETLHGITRFGKPGGASVEKIVLADFMRDILAIASFAPRAKGVKFELEESGEKGLEVTASRADLQQAFFNIVKNAVEAISDNPDGKHVRISIKRERGDVLVSVSDNGPGIPQETMASIFRKSVTTKADGTGVGLLITRDLLVRNRGEVKLRNRDDGGLTVLATLPIS